MGVDLGRFRRKIWQTLSSVKTGVILLILVIILAAVGTIVLQRPTTDPDELQRAYSPQVLYLFDKVGLTDVFHAWWFVLLMVLVSLCIIAASIDRFPNAWRYFARPYKYPDQSFRKSLPTQRQIPIHDEDSGLVAAEHALNSMGFRPERVVRSNHFSLFAERNRFAEVAVYIVHASLLLIFLGGIVDALWGWQGTLMLTKGQQSQQVEMQGGKTRELPFAIRCEGAGQENYPDGTPKKWWSNLVVVKGGREVERKQVVVNGPLVYQGIRFYQSSYGSNGKVEQLILTVTPRGAQSGAKEIALSPGEPIDLDADTRVKLAEFIPDYVVRDGQVYTRSVQMENPAAHLIVTSAKSGQAINVWLPAIEGFAENDEAPYTFAAQVLKMGYFTGLQVSHEPGQWLVWGGVLLMGVGLALVFYMSHVRLWVVPVRDARGQLQLWVGGTTNRNRDAFESHFQEFTEKVAADLKSDQVSPAAAPEAALAGK
jgi:cytochrome c biogenesis protein